MRKAALALALVLASCAKSPSGRVDPTDHDAFFVWAGVKPQPVLERAKVLYLLAGEVRRNSGFVPLRATPRVGHGQVWLVVRTERLDWDDATFGNVLRDLERWRAAGNPLAGLQIDFDAATKGLDRYGVFLRDLRARLPRNYRLSVTGLMDWAANGDPATLANLSGTVDEVVVQTYQGRSTIRGYERYFARLAQLPIPHRVALVENGEWRTPPELARDPRFTGYVVFLLPPRS